MITLLNYNINGTTVSDETLTINTSEAQVLVHDNFFDVEVYTGASKTGDEITNFVLGLYDSFYSTYNTIQFSSNNGETVYITYKTKGDYVDAEDINIKVDKVISAASGNFAGLDANGNITDSGSKPADFNLYTHPNHSGDVTSVGDGATTIANDAVTNAKLANMAVNTIKGRITSSTGDPEDLTATQVRTIINVANGAEVNQNTFSTVAVSGQSNVVADSKTDTLTFVAGTNITITTDAGADSITINASGGTASSDFGAL